MSKGGKLMTTKELDVLIGELVKEHGFDYGQDNDGQYVIYTGLWQDEDGDLYLESPADEEEEE
jgi:hypothetical protein